MRNKLVLAATAAMMCASVVQAEAADGAALYERRCGACHSLDAHRVGPLHRGVVGRQAGGLAGYDYSSALRSSRVVWTPDTLDAWLADPEGFIPGQRMGFRLRDAVERAAVIDYLATEAQ